LRLFPIRREQGPFQRSCVGAGHQDVLLPLTRNRSCPDGCGGEEPVQPLRWSLLGQRAWWDRPGAVAPGTAGPASQPGQETSRPHTIQPLPFAPCSSRLTAFPPLVSQPTPGFSSSASQGNPAAGKQGGFLLAWPLPGAGWASGQRQDLGQGGCHFWGQMLTREAPGSPGHCFLCPC